MEAVRAVATGEATTPVEARRRLVADALFAAEGAQRFAGTGLVDSARRAALARVLLERVRNDVAAGEPPTEDEWRDALAGRWVEFDRPAAVLTRHAIVRFKEGRDREAARPVAERIASAVSGAESAEEFMERANAVDGGEFEILVQSLPSVTADGRTFYLDHSGKPVRAAGYFDPNFAAAANAIEEEGTMSPVTESRMPSS